jgi:uncharacterized membrane protein
MLGLYPPFTYVISKKLEDKKMNVNFQYNKNLAIEGSILLWLSVVPYVGWVLGIIGVVLLLRSMKEFSNYYQDESIYKNTLTGIKYYIVAIIAAAVAIASFAIGVWTATGFTAHFELTAAFGVGIIAGIAGLVIAFVFFVLASLNLRKTFNTLAQKSGEHSFETAGTLLMIGSILTIIGVGLLLIVIAWIFATIGFFTMKPPQYQQYTEQPNGSSPTYTQPTQGTTA